VSGECARRTLEHAQFGAVNVQLDVRRRGKRDDLANLFALPAV